MSDLELVLTQRRFSVVISGVPKYKIEMSVAPGAESTGMPNHVFVMKIGSTESSDSFARIATLADLDLIQTLRSVAVDRGHTEYRTSKSTVSFDDIDTAIAAVPVIKDRVNSLVKTWQKARTDFLSETEVTDLPMPAASLSVQDAYKKAYTDSVDARKLAEAAQEEAQAAYESSISDTAHVKEIKDIHCGYSDKLLSLYGLTPDETFPASPASALAAAVTALNQCADQSSRCTRVANNKKGTIGSGSTLSVIFIPPGSFVAGDSDVYKGHILVVTFSDGHKEARTISSLPTTSSIAVFQNFTTFPEESDKWEIRFLSDYLPIDDFGAASSAATRAQAALDSLVSTGGYVAALSSLLSEAEANCSTYSNSYDSSVASEASKLSSLEAAKAKKDAAQSASNKAASDLLEACPDADLEALSK